MHPFRSLRIPSFFRWILWALGLQLLLINISAALYAYQFTHFYEAPAARPPLATQDVLGRTWKLFSGPRIYKSTRLELPSFPFEHCSFPLADGTPIRGWYSQADSARGCVILFHGLMVNKGYLISEADQFRQMGYNVLLVDFRAHGESGGQVSTLGVDETEEVEKAFQYARARGNREVILYGVSMGAAACLKALAEGRVQPRALVADMPFGCLQSHLEARARIQGFPAQPFAFLVTFWSGVERGFNGFDHRPSQYAGRVHCPVLLQWGNRDPYVLKGETESVFKALRGPKTLAVYAGAGHESFLHREPQQWQREVTQFLKKS